MQEALAQMRDRRFLQSQMYQEQQWRAFREGAHPKIREFEKLLVRRMAALGVPMFAHTMVRNVQTQKKLFLDGVTKNDGTRPYPHRGFAVDIVHSIEGWNLSKLEWALVGHVGKEVAASRGIKVQWGGDWKFYDPAHWELIGWKGMYETYPFPAFPPAGG